MGITLQEAPVAGNTTEYEHPMMKFARMLDRMKEDHAELRENLKRIADKAAALHDGVPGDRTLEAMDQLCIEVRAFMEQLERHAKDEDDALFPTVALYAEPELTTREEKTAVLHHTTQCFTAFLERNCECKSGADAEQARDAAEMLLKGCKVLRHLLLEEADTIYPLAEEIISDIDYLSC